jgi:cytoskeletal protein CcmA (bactofilin family)
MADKKSNGRTGEKKTIIEEGTEFKGTLAASCPILARGRIEGEISGPALEVTDTGVVAGQVKVTELRSRGELAGKFEADEVMLSGRVRDETVIVAKALEVTPARAGAVAVELDDCELQIGELPSKEQAIRDAMAAGQPQ